MGSIGYICQIRQKKWRKINEQALHGYSLIELIKYPDTFLVIWLGGGLKIQKRVRAGLAPLGNFCSATIAQACQPSNCLILIFNSLPYSNHRKTLYILTCKVTLFLVRILHAHFVIMLLPANEIANLTLICI